MVIDMPSDKGLAHFHAISKILSLPDFVKQADFSQQVEVDDLPREAFADSLERKFPIHTKAAAYVSYAYFKRQADKLQKDAVSRCNQGFAKAAEFWDLGTDYAAMDKAMVKKAAVASPTKFALQSEKFFPINSPTEILKSAEHLDKSRGNFDYVLRAQAAKNIMKAAVEAGLPTSMLPDSVHKMAGHGLTTKEAALLELTKRYDSEKRPSMAQPLKLCIDKFSSLKSDLLGGEVCEKLAGILDVYDRSKGEKSFPEDVLFAFTKRAADKLAGSVVSMIDGTSYLINDLEKAADAFQVLGKDIVDAIKNLDGSLNPVKVAELIDTLPRIDADLLKDALGAMGVRPFNMDKKAMVSLAASKHQGATLSTVLPKTEKRANILQRMEASDPMVKRALSVLRRLKTAEEAESEKEEANDFMKSPRDFKGLFMKKAPNETKTETVE